MPNGGPRPGAGRKPAVPDGHILTVIVSEAILNRTPKPWAVTIRRLLEEKFGEEKKE